MSLCRPVFTRDLFVAWVTTLPIGSPDITETATYACRDVKLRLQYCAGYESKFSLRGREYAATGIPRFEPGGVPRRIFWEPRSAFSVITRSARVYDALSAPPRFANLANSDDDDDDDDDDEAPN